ncbi:hypothetical protein [uncultured Shewanella sp.]|uniref:hypothetical protein n=1 Tax=uncultured Shewanella sp. TaxID=173975 RepID=UPI0026324EB2|nr:hypothetical protein [uncultured Shewanella sp.]
MLGLGAGVLNGKYSFVLCSDDWAMMDEDHRLWQTHDAKWLSCFAQDIQLWDLCQFRRLDGFTAKYLFCEN